MAAPSPFSPSEDFPASERVFEAVHVDPLAAESHALHAQPAALFERGVLAQLDLSAGTQYAMPGKGIRRIDPEQAGHGAMVKRIPGGSRHLAVRAHLSGRNGENDAPEGLLAIFIGHQAVAND